MSDKKKQGDNVKDNNKDDTAPKKRKHKMTKTSRRFENRRQKEGEMKEINALIERIKLEAPPLGVSRWFRIC